MSALNARALGRGLRAFLCAIGVLKAGAPPPAWSATATLARETSGDLFATVEIFHKLTLAPGQTDASLVAATAVPIAAVRPATAHLRRPLAAQLAVTAARNVRKGREPAKSNAAPSQAAVSRPRKGSTIKAKPVVKVAQRKRAPKRRHVWLSTQTRVVRPPAANVVSLHAAHRHQRPGSRNVAHKQGGRALRLAA